MGNRNAFADKRVTNHFFMSEVLTCWASFGQVTIIREQMKISCKNELMWLIQSNNDVILPQFRTLDIVSWVPAKFVLFATITLL